MTIRESSRPHHNAIGPCSETAAGALPPELAKHCQCFLEVLVDMSLRGVGIADPSGVIRYTNSVCHNIYGLKASEIVGHHFKEFYFDSEALNQMLAQARTQGRVDNYPIQARHSSGVPVPVEVSLVRIHDGPGVCSAASP